MNHTGVMSVVSRRHARRNRSNIPGSFLAQRGQRQGLRAAPHTSEARGVSIPDGRDALGYSRARNVSEQRTPKEDAFPDLVPDLAPPPPPARKAPPPPPMALPPIEEPKKAETTSDPPGPIDFGGAIDLDMPGRPGKAAPPPQPTPLAARPPATPPTGQAAIALDVSMPARAPA